MIQTQTVHDLFRGSAEISKFLKNWALGVEFLAAIVSVPGLFSASGLVAWRPMWVFSLLLVSVLTRAVAEHYAAFAEKCRRLSVKAFAAGQDIPVRTSSSLMTDAPLGAITKAKKLPASTLDAYYEPSFPPGEDRLRELYAYSAFYTSRLLAVSKWLYLMVTVSLVAGAALVMYYLVTSPVDASRREFLLEALFPIVLGVVAIRFFELFFATSANAASSRRVADDLIAQPLPGGNQLHELVHDYDIERVGSPPPPTVVYRLLRDSVDKEWKHRRDALKP